ncbi:MAG: Gfo/Idh/MocA family oxidoreductase [Acidimicrobiia bacterium]|nr:Gfo/Idh/MocA family oxidoreductase [Acidimicrobiia bacterium]
MAPEPLRLALVGLGRHALKTVLPAVAAAEGWSLAAVVSSRPEAASEIGSEHGVAYFTDLDDALESERPDAVYVATTPADHLAPCATALDAGVPVVICEKPLAVLGDDANRLIAAARGASSVLVEVMAYQHHPQFRAVEELIGSDEVGDLVHGYARFSFPHLGADDFRYRAAAGGGALLDAGVYPLSMAVRLLGSAEVEVNGSVFQGGGEVDIAGTATLTDGAGRSFQCSWGMGSAYANLARLVGTAGTIEVARPFSKPPSFDEPLTLIDGWGGRTERPYAATDQFAAMLDDIARHRHDAAWVETTHRETEARWAVIDAVRRSAG